MHYHFVDMSEMESAVEGGEFLEHARVHTNIYGTSAKSVREVRTISGTLTETADDRQSSSYSTTCDMKILMSTSDSLHTSRIDLGLTHYCRSAT